MSNNGNGGTPPQDTRFKPGQSGNPRGRPRKPRFNIYHVNHLRELFLQQGVQRVQIVKHGKSLDVRKIEAVFERLYQKALSGDMAAARFVVSLTFQHFDIKDLNNLRLMEVLQTVEEVRRDKMAAADKQHKTPTQKQAEKEKAERSAQARAKIEEMVKAGRGQMDEFLKKEGF